ncbi:MerR family transcriptional regulator [Bacillus sp. FJAT-28004]|uniref:MerR family transcriptional regulator n=1 Tax=Bacillus sp. FJAT-28004 TaxID=1679165 RepID=UPI0006B587B5|nr:MerR family transcriptional regulator [Bacillus sp. FJAT-28004]
MALLKTKEAAQLLTVSETTVRRWVSQFPSSFHKDMHGHYTFDETALDKLHLIKRELEDGSSLQAINLSPDLPDPLPLTPPPPAYEDREELLNRLSRLETSLSQKADEVVTYQLLSHRQELDELRHILTQLTRSMDALQLPQQHIAAASLSATDRNKRRKLLRILFPFL